MAQLIEVARPNYRPLDIGYERVVFVSALLEMVVSEVIIQRPCAW